MKKNKHQKLMKTKKRIVENIFAVKYYNNNGSESCKLSVFRSSVTNFAKKKKLSTKYVELFTLFFYVFLL